MQNMNKIVEIYFRMRYFRRQMVVIPLVLHRVRGVKMLLMNEVIFWNRHPRMR